MQLETIKTDVLIVGAGPTGLTLANILGQHNVAVVVVERKDTTVGEPRAVSIDDESLRTMQAIGLVSDVMEDVVSGYGVHYFTSPSGKCFAKVEPSASEYGYPRRNAFRQPLFEATLHQGLKRFPSVALLFGHTLDSFEQNGRGVTALISRADGSRVHIQASYMIGSDGGRSIVREMLGVAMAGSTFKSRWLVVDTENDDDPFWQTRVYCDADRPVVDVPGPHRTRRFEVLIHPHEDAEVATSEARVAELLHPFRQGRSTEIVRKVVYTFHARMAEKWRVGRVFLAGDAAHLTPPYAGQGLNSGIRDAHNLGWKLAGVLAGKLSDAALDSYETERRPHAWALIRLALNLGEVMAPRSRLHARFFHTFFTLSGFIPPIRDYFLQMKFKPKPHYANGLLGPESVGRGQMFPQPYIRTLDGQVCLLDDITGHRYALISYGEPTVLKPASLTHPLWSSLEAVRICILAADQHVNTDQLPSGCVVVVDKDDALRFFFAERRGEIVLLRPDRYIAGTFDVRNQAYFESQFSTTLGVSAHEGQVRMLGVESTL